MATGKDIDIKSIKTKKYRLYSRILSLKKAAQQQTLFPLSFDETEVLVCKVPDAETCKGRI